MMDAIHGPSMTVTEWCRSHGISYEAFKRLKRDGKGPRTYSVGKRQRVSAAADREWVAKRESESMTSRGINRHGPSESVSLRDWFAGMALLSLDFHDSAENKVRLAFAIADAMMDERAR